MKIATKVVRIVMGLGFVVFGANIVHSFLPQPPLPAGSPAVQFMMVMVPSHWMTLVGIIQLLGGAFLLLEGTAPIGLTMLGPVLVNILAFHTLLMGGEGIAPGAVFTGMELFLIYSYRSSFAPILTTGAAPTSA